MSSIKTDLEVAVVDAINAAAAGLVFTTFTAVRKRMPEKTLEQIEGVQVMVMVGELQAIREVRGRTGWSTRREMGLEVGVTKKVGFDSIGDFNNVNADEVYEFVDELAAIVTNTLTPLVSSGAFEPQTDYHPSPFLESKGVAACQISSTFWVWVERRDA